MLIAVEACCNVGKRIAVYSYFRCATKNSITVSNTDAVAVCGVCGVCEVCGPASLFLLGAPMLGVLNRDAVDELLLHQRQVNNRLIAW
jgi:hypothetical protein